MTTPNLGPGNVPNVPGAQPINQLGFAAHASENEAGWREGIDGQWKDRANNSGIGAIFTALTGLVSNVVSIFSSLGELFQTAADQGADIQDLQDKTTNMTESTGQATAYMTDSPGTTTSPQRMPFKTWTRPPKNVTSLGDGRWRLELAGEWDIFAQVEFWGGALMPPGTYLEILVRAPDGSVYDGVKAIADSNKNITVTNVTTTQIPTPGYTVEVRAWTDDLPLVGGTFRGIRGGYSTTRLMIRKFELEAA